MYDFVCITIAMYYHVLLLLGIIITLAWGRGRQRQPKAESPVSWEGPPNQDKWFPLDLHASPPKGQRPEPQRRKEWEWYNWVALLV